MNKPLIVIMEETRGKIKQVIVKTLKDSGLPAFLLEGIVMEVLAEVRAGKNEELTIAYGEISQKLANIEQDSKKEEGE